jgi:hypothetical protein
MNALVPNGGGLPAIWKPVKPTHFYKFTRDADFVVQYFDELLEVIRELRSGGLPMVGHLDDPEQIEMVDDCLESLRRYDRDGKDDPRYDEDGDLTSAHVSDRLAMMLAAWTSKPKFEAPKQAERWMMIMIQHVMALEPSAVELEAACRRLIDEGKPFCPETPEVIKALKAEQKAWEPRKQAICNTKRLIEEIREEIPKAKARAEKAKIEAEKRKAEEEAAAARYRAQTEAAIARRKAEEEAEFFRELERKVDEQIKKAYAYGRDIKFSKEAAGLEAQLDFARTWYMRLPFPPDGLPSGFKPALRELGMSVAEQCVIAFALGVFETRRRKRVWESAIEAEAPALPPARRSSSKRSRRVEPNPTKLAAARTEQITGEQTNDTVALAACARPSAKRTQKPKGGQS